MGLPALVRNPSLAQVKVGALFSGSESRNTGVLRRYREVVVRLGVSLFSTLAYPWPLRTLSVNINGL